MPLPRMDSDPTSSERLPRAVRPESTVAEAGAYFRATGELVAPVLRGGRPVGLVSAHAVSDAVRSGACDAPILSVMDYAAVTVRRGADAGEVLRTFNRAAWEWLRSTRPATHRNRRRPLTL
jgi:CBS domain-containing protein